MIAEVIGIKKLNYSNEVSIDLRVTEGPQQIKMSIFYYVSLEAAKDYSIGDKFTVELWRADK